MSTFLDYLTVLALAALLLAPALYGALRERRIDRQLRAAAPRAPRPRTTERPRPEPRSPKAFPRGRGRSRSVIGS
ncbi:hypothetical protein ACIRP0_01140 [Streptomyces sp. NPDC101733]|uniref:hypothetical protein n=1 Tax=unclassified Streptomyces TaxID=2593676 RepID=UPI0037F8030D